MRRVQRTPWDASAVLDRYKSGEWTVHALRGRVRNIGARWILLAHPYYDPSGEWEQVCTIGFATRADALSFARLGIEAGMPWGLG